MRTAMRSLSIFHLGHLGAAMAFLAAAAGPAAAADQVQLDLALGHPVLKADEKRTTYVRVGLTGFRFAREADRAPVNVAIVLDTSGSMQGDKIARAREAAILAVQRLGPRDIASVVEYNETVRVIVPATRLTDVEPVLAAIGRLQAGGTTALFAGVAKGAEEVRKFLDRGRVNRVILLSDGIANVGPSSPLELGDLGASLIKEGISVSTIGLGDAYNEDLMSQLARRSDGNHYFAEGSADLARIFKNELGDILAVAAQEVRVAIECAEGIRPIRVLGREADISGQKVTVYLNQIYSEQQKYVLLEVEVPATAAGLSRAVATVEVSYANMLTRATEVLRGSVTARFAADGAEVERQANTAVIVAAVEQLAVLTSKLAMKLRDEGKIEEAQAMLRSNSKFLDENAVKLKSEYLRRYAEVQKEDEKAIASPKAYKSKARRKMVAEQNARESQQESK